MESEEAAFFNEGIFSGGGAAEQVESIQPPRDYLAYR